MPSRTSGPSWTDLPLMGEIDRVLDGPEVWMTTCMFFWNPHNLRFISYIFFTQHKNQINSISLQSCRHTYTNYHSPENIATSQVHSIKVQLQHLNDSEIFYRLHQWTPNIPKINNYHNCSKYFFCSQHQKIQFWINLTNHKEPSHKITDSEYSRNNINFICFNKTCNS